MARQFGRAIEAGGRILVPVAASLRVRAPGGVGGLVWSRPVGVRIEEAEGSRYLPIRDRTRELQWVLLGVGLAAAIWIRLARLGRKR